LQKYSDKITIITQKNQGLFSALNTGITTMKGRWFKWFSPDDIMNNNTIELLVSESLKSDEDTIIYSNWDIIDETGHLIRGFSESNFNNLSKFDFGVRLLDGQQININTSLIPSSLFKMGCTIRNLKDPIIIDYDLLLRASILYNFKFHLVEKPLIKYRIHSKQLSHNKIIESLDFLNEIQKELLEKIPIEQRKKYIEGLNKFKKQKPFSKKSMDTGLKIMSTLIPKAFANKLLLFYLNHLRSSR
jgi:hypothetical protein